MKWTNTHIPTGSYTQKQSKDVSGTLECNYPITEFRFYVLDEYGNSVDSGVYYPNKVSYTFNYNESSYLFSSGDYSFHFELKNVWGTRITWDKYHFHVGAWG